MRAFFSTAFVSGRCEKKPENLSEFKFQIINITNNYNVLLYIWDHTSSPSKVEAYSMFPIILTFGWEFKI